MNFFDKIHETQIIRTRGKKPFEAFIPLHRRLFPLDSQRQCAIARAAVLEVLG
jgi:hypothetical protein